MGYVVYTNWDSLPSAAKSLAMTCRKHATRDAWTRTTRTSRAQGWEAEGAAVGNDQFSWENVGKWGKIMGSPSETWEKSGNISLFMVVSGKIICFFLGIFQSLNVWFELRCVWGGTEIRRSRAGWGNGDFSDNSVANPQKTQLLWVGKAHFPHFSDDYHTWWLIPVSKWVITLVINGISGGNVHL